MSEARDYTFVTPSEGFWARAYYTPLTDAVRGRLSARLDIRRDIAAFGLPEEVSGLIYAVVRRTRLKMAEQCDVVRELAGHFADGLASGVPTERLVEQFGPPETAGRLIRRAKLRQRSPLAKTLRAVKLVTGGVLAGLVLLYLGLLVRFQLARPTLAHDYWRELNSQRQAPAGAVPAWPMYQQALARLDAEKLRDSQVIAWMADGPGGSHWDEAEAVARKYRDVVDLAHEASKHPHLGFLLAPLESETDPNPSLIYALLPHAQGIRTLIWLVLGDAWLAAAEGDSARVMDDVAAMLRMAEHCWPPQSTLIEQLVALAGTNQALTLVGRLIEREPELFNDAQLRDLAHLLAAHLGGGRLRADFRFERIGMLDMIQRTFTDDGQGGGRLTAGGLRELQRWGSSDSGGANEGPLAGEVAFQLVGAPVCLVVADREDQVRVMDEFYALVESNTVPPWEWTSDAADDYLRNMAKSQAHRMRYMPLMLMLPAVSSAQNAFERTIQLRDATLVVLALELFHRREGRWPADLKELTPGFLPEVPPDRCDGAPLRYLVRDDRPVLYSLGANFADDGGQRGERAEQMVYFDRKAVLSGKKQPVGPGDWILFPPAPPKGE